MEENRKIHVYEVLDKLGISYRPYEHPPVFTVEEAERHWKGIHGTHCKNLFLRNKKGNAHYLCILEHSKRADLKYLSRRLNEERLSFGSAERLMRLLGLETGAVSPFGLINDSQHEVRVVIDNDLESAETVNFHPNVNTTTLGISFSDFKKFLDWCGNPVIFLDMSDTDR